jgi:hypothetical protein
MSQESQERVTTRYSFHEAPDGTLLSVKIEVPGEEPLFISPGQLTAIHVLFKEIGLAKESA